MQLTPPSAAPLSGRAPADARGAARTNGNWCSTLTAAASVTTARVLVNAAGPWIGGVADTSPAAATSGGRLIKGSHIVVRRRFRDMITATSWRLRTDAWCSLLPFAQDFTLIGTTDENFVGDLNAPAPEPHEIVYLCDGVNHYFREQVTPDELVWSFSGVRALYDDGSDKPEDVTRDYELVSRQS